MAIKLPAPLAHWLKPNIIAGLAVIALLVWVGWSLQQAWFDRPLPPERIQAQQLRVNSGKLTTLNKNLAAYHQPTAAPTPSSTALSNQ